MKIVEVILGLAGDGGPLALRAAPHAGLSEIPLDRPGLDPETVARAVRETIAAPVREAATDAIPFIRVVARAGDVELAIADDTAAGRMLTETRGGGVPLIVETAGTEGEAHDARVEALLGRVALAAGTEDAAQLLAALASEERGDGRSGPLSEEALAFVAAQGRATKLAREVRAIDDRMTASVVPDWLWIATGLGGAAVFLTVVALLYPDLRVYVVPALIVLSVLGFGAYGWRAWRELQTRGVLLVERAELRARREAARAEVRSLAEHLTARGHDAAAILLGHASVPVPRDVPAVIGRAPARDPAAGGGAPQVIAFVPEDRGSPETCRLTPV